jgi:hypothetical protein
VTEKPAKAWFVITPEAAKALKAKLDKEREAKIVTFPAKAEASALGLHAARQQARAQERLDGGG